VSSRAGLSLEELCAELAEFAPQLSGDGEVVVTDVEQDSRRITPGSLFVARVGGTRNGLWFVDGALERGASAVMIAAGTEAPALSCPVLRVSDLSRAIGFAAEAVHGEPSHSLALVGVTGTNGKTTVTWLVQRALEALGMAAARIGTLGFEFAGERDDVHLTTPEADVLSRYLASVARAGGKHAVMEVSSAALVQGRVDAVRFDVAAFTNLTRDHIDFHGTFDAYRQAKAKLFHELEPRVAVLMVDDEFGRSLCATTGAVLVRVAASSTGRVDIDGAGLTPRPSGISGEVRFFGHPIQLRSRLIGKHNTENLMVALGILHALGIEGERAVRALEGVGAAPGRLERCDGPDDDFSVLVDYAHTPDALERVLAAVKPPLPGRLICVFGCGGDRDPGKRAPMGQAVGQRADHAIITNDNPRTEAPQSIAEAVERGLAPTGASYEVCLDREQAIERAVGLAHADDVVLIAGKGHEPYQIIGDREFPFDDREQARRALARRRAALGGGGQQWPR
jgi:UDP-N-acetylmuramoyl-L-alanyl-D-glutamate--2,6-diaminopimelate ligase